MDEVVLPVFSYDLVSTASLEIRETTVATSDGIYHFIEVAGFSRHLGANRTQKLVHAVSSPNRCG